MFTKLRLVSTGYALGEDALESLVLMPPISQVLEVLVWATPLDTKNIILKSRKKSMRGYDLVGECLPTWRNRVGSWVQSLVQGQGKGMVGKGGGRGERRRRRYRKWRWGRRGRWVMCAVLALDWVFRSLDILGSARQIICIKLEETVKIPEE